jgi:DNA-binding MarR family transcriptional regulator
MGDEKNSRAPQNNIRGLVQDLSERLDARSNDLRAGTPFASARPADAKTFMLISRHPRGLTELATALKISRQAAHKSVLRLVEIGVVDFDYAKGSKRDMVAKVTDAGIAAQKVGRLITATIEEDIRAKIGTEDLENLRRILGTLVS